MSENTTDEYPIKTVVVLVQENRSFDHILGWMKSLNAEIDGVTGEESNPLSASDRIHFGHRASNVVSDPGHSFEATFEQVFGVTFNDAPPNPAPTMEGFARQAETIQEGMAEVVMNGFTPESVPVFRQLVSEFAVCDRWFSSAPTLTQPNRLFIHSATAYGATANDTKMLVQGYPQKTIFESMEESGFSFGVYYQYPPSTLFYRNLRKLKYVRNFHQFELSFKRHCKEGKLPNYVVIEQRYFETKLVPGNDDHPPHDISEGQRFVKEVYEALRSSPQWNEILFVIIYDEHGGFYDHVPTPVAGVPSPDDIVGPEPHKFKFDRLGVRVPAILVSPWIEPGTVLHGPSGPYPTSEFEHSSIPATVKKLFNLKSFLTKRDAWAGTFECVLNRTAPRTDCPVSLPEPVKTREAAADEEAKLSEFQGELVQLCAVLRGEDANTGVFPAGKAAEGMKVVEAAEYVGSAFRKFLDDCDDARRNGADESYIVCAAKPPPKRRSKSLAGKIFSCITCGNN
ncbi:non-specific phospholipase C3-like isoform X2 [Andrographis paniculata]|uniref:non-specific phospholipase C3-like isoform X2 n=1 Tax=Andrographis paniculata TaxID=175694 RepID=UPI0021E6E8B8|nr:non-specific phospholipase C3-like isoform X2 [Andrographis paniculata]